MLTFCYPLLQALRLLPGVRPKIACAQLGEAKFKAAHNCDGQVEIGGTNVGLEALEQLFIPDARRTPRITPAGAALLLRLHEAGAFDTDPHARGVGSLIELKRYAASLPDLIACQAQRERARDKLAQIVEHPEDAIAPTLSFALLSAVFERHRGIGPGRLRVGEIVVTKHCVVHAHGRKEHSVRFTWTDQAGVARELTRPGAAPPSSVAMLRERAFARLGTPPKQDI